MVHIIQGLPRLLFPFPRSIFPLRILEKWVEVIPHLRTDFGTLSTSLRKLVIYPILGLLKPPSPFSQSIGSFRDPWEVIKGCSSPRNGLLNLRYIQSSGYRNPYFPSHDPFVPLGNLDKWLEVIPHPRMDFGTLGDHLKGKTLTS